MGAFLYFFLKISSLALWWIMMYVLYLCLQGRGVRGRSGFSNDNFKGTVSRDAISFNVLGLGRSRSWFFNFVEAPLILYQN